jgi:putative copper resistance protein D
MTLLGLALRLVQLASGIALVGVFTAALLAGRSDRPTARAWGTRVVSLGRGLLAGLAVSGVGALAHQAAVATGRPGALLEPAAWIALLGHSRYGTVWLVRHALLLLLAAIALPRLEERSTADWASWRAEAAALAAAGAAAMAWAGHAAAADPWELVAPLIDALHIVAAGAWAGALLPLAWLLGAGSREAGADARPFAVLAVRRFSAAALWVMLLIAATGIANAWVQVGSVPALLGTRYGALLLAKGAVLVAILALAARGRRLLPALSRAAAVGRPAMARLARSVAGEGGLALVVLAITAALAVTTPGRHDAPYWPFAHRLDWSATAGVPGVKARLVIGSQLALLGVLGAAIGALLRPRRAAVIGAGAAGAVLGLAVALPPLAVDAYPTTYVRPAVPYQASSIASGARLYAAHCAKCHGRGGTGDGPGGAGLRRPPADLTAPHTGQHTAGDLFWWITHGFPASGMPPFGNGLGPDERWDLVNFLRALSAGYQARALAPVAGPPRPWLGAPDFTYAVGPAPPRSLKDLRGRAATLLVLFSLPESRPRLARLAEVYGELGLLGAEVIAVPLDGDPRVLSRLGGEPPVLYPVATDGGPDIVTTYMLFRRTLAPDGLRPEAPSPAHAEFLVDRQGYLRARWIPSASGKSWDDLGLLRDEIQSLAREAPAAPFPDVHVH